MDSDASRLGRYGSIWAAQTAAYTAPTGTFFCAFTFVSATIFTSLTGNGVASPGSVAATNTNTTFAGASSTLAGMSIPAGCTIYGMWTAFQLASGSLIAYKVASNFYQPG
jgi:hypothetical protein